MAWFTIYRTFNYIYSTSNNKTHTVVMPLATTASQYVPADNITVVYTYILENN